MREMKPEQEDSREIKDELQLPEEEKPGFWGDSLADSGETDTDEKAEAAYYEARRQERHERILLRRKRRKRNCDVKMFRDTMKVLPICFEGF